MKKIQKILSSIVLMTLFVSSVTPVFSITTHAQDNLPKYEGVKILGDSNFQP